MEEYEAIEAILAEEGVAEEWVSTGGRKRWKQIANRIRPFVSRLTIKLVTCQAQIAHAPKAKAITAPKTNGESTAGE